MKTFIALYRGGTVASAELIAVTADPAIIAHVSERLLGDDTTAPDPVVEKLEGGRRSALDAIHREALEDSRGRGRFSVVPSSPTAAQHDDEVREEGDG